MCLSRNSSKGDEGVNTNNEHPDEETREEPPPKADEAIDEDDSLSGFPLKKCPAYVPTLEQVYSNVDEEEEGAVPLYENISSIHMSA